MFAQPFFFSLLSKIIEIGLTSISTKLKILQILENIEKKINKRDFSFNNLVATFAQICDIYTFLKVLAHQSKDSLPQIILYYGGTAHS